MPYAESDARNISSENTFDTRSLSDRRQQSKIKKTNNDFKSAPGSLSGRQGSSIDLLNQLIDNVKSKNHSIAGVLRGCSLKNYDGKKFIIEAKFKFHKEKLEDLKTRVIIEDALKEITGKKISINFVLKS